MKLAFIVAMLLATEVSAHACAGKIETFSARRPLIYNPFSVVDAHLRLAVTIRNTGSETCSYRLSIPDSYRPLLFENIAFTIDARDASNETPGTFSVTTPSVAAGQTHQLRLRLSASRGQPALSGDLTKRVGFVLTEAGAQGLPLDQTELDLHCLIPPVFEINVAGSGLRATLEIDDSKLPSKAVVLQTRSTQSHRLQIRAENGFLVREGSLPSATTIIPYEVAIDGLSRQLQKDAVWQVDGPAGEASRRLSVTIGDTFNKLAGLYKEVITVHIDSKL
ncbi:hypothetical protein Rvan_3185 [Rhodomicrobium vannielii ATCC 17100]|jgi:hypothetical protein|uniref:Uncharacterized protein n=1 Tax=Rhodomicrobium vannielii (strain ATCC 17100 / DSM 162 / LMG 4299 / NCIMB 10020 / ATH 3.1.1) TaxID=648757 RepID=E3I1K6_RHOVT|nr:hypothetical protein [Rhodomicrobium vannielii]ADP72381.1 hypothetical protein Rvan_3185 [Rhodomicrobium vannielii ATCC 17100]